MSSPLHPVVFSEKALAEFEETVAYVRRESPESAISVAKAIWE